jgi:hypothetical protein
MLSKFLASPAARVSERKAFRESRTFVARRVALVAVVAFGGLASVFASAAIAAPLDGETLTGTIQAGCVDNGDGTSSLSVSRGADTSGAATGPVVGTYDGRFFANWDNATGSVTAGRSSLNIYPVAGTTINVSPDLGSGHGVASCTASGWSVNLTDATYTTDSGDTGVFSVSASGSSDGGTPGTFTANFGPQMPTTKEQCKNGGWKTYPAFKNQGDCVSYVATKGKNPPARG